MFIKLAPLGKKKRNFDVYLLELFFTLRLFYSVNRADHETEARYQAMVDKYFAESVIAPSPWSEQAERSRRFPLPSSASSSSPEVFRREEREIASQTMLSFPPDLDLTKILGYIIF